MLRFLVTITFGYLAASVHGMLPKINKGRIATRATGSYGLSDGYDVMTKFESSDCSGTTTLAIATADCYSASYYDDVCYLANYFEASSSLLNKVPYSHYQESCTTDLKTFADDAFGDQVYVRYDYFDSYDCSGYIGSNILIADGECHSMIQFDDNYEAIAVSFKVTVNPNGTISYDYYYDSTGCNGAPDSYFFATKEMLSINACDDSWYMKVYTNLDVNDDGDGISVSSATGGGGLSTGAIVGIAVGCFAFVVIIVGLFFWRRKVRSQSNQAEQWVQYPTTPDRV